MSGRGAQAFGTLCRWLDRLERLVLTVLVAGMIALGAVQILLRNVWHTGLDWAEPLLGMALLWLTMLGALAAAGLGRHLSIDLATALLPRRWSAWLGRATSLFAAVVCGLLAWAAGRYVGFQREMDMSLVVGLSVWKHYLVVPVVFWLLALRLAVRAFLPTSWLGASRESPEWGGEGRTAS